MYNLIFQQLQDKGSYHDIYMARYVTFVINVIHLYMITCSNECFHGFFPWCSFTFITLFTGILFLSVQYLWRLWEDGIIQQLCGEFPQACKAIAECDKQASIIEKGIFDLHNDFKRAYVCNYIFNELLAWTLLISNFLYYVFLLHIPHTGYFNLIGNMLKPNLENDIRKFEMDYLIELFPREIACTYFAFDPSGKESSVTYRCKVTNQDANEFLHITAALFSTFLMSLLILHAITVAWKYLHFNKSLGKAYTLELSRISLRNKVILLLVCNNIDTTTKMTLLRKFSDRSVDKDCLLQDALGTP